MSAEDWTYLSACCGKETFDSRMLAEKVAKRRRRGGKVRNVAYKCPVCDEFHIGAAPSKRRVIKRKR